MDFGSAANPRSASLDASNSAEVGLLSAFGEPGELEVLKHALTERRGHDRGPRTRSEEITTARNHGLRLRRVSRIDESVGMPMTDEDRRGTLDGVESTCREAAYLNLRLQRTRSAGR
jgi:hypothetical protein